AWVPGNSGGESETIIGDWMRRRRTRNSVVIATKVGAHPQFEGLASRTIARAADASLRRLRSDHIDIYFAHFDDESVPLIEVVAAFQRLIDAGKVRYMGLSNYSPERVEEWLTLARESGLDTPVALQPHYNLVHRRPYEEAYAPIAAANDLGVLPYSALASGFLTGKYRTQADLEGKARGAAAGKYLTEEGLSVLRALDTIAADRSVPVASVAIAWLASRPTVTAPLASATSVEQLKELMIGARLELTTDEEETLGARL